MKINIGIDHGNRNIKTVHTVFTSGISASKAKSPFASVDTIKFDETYYSLATEPAPFTQDKTINRNFYYLTLMGIAKELVHRGMPNGTYDVKLGVGLPPKHMAALQDKFKNYFLEDSKRLDIEYQNRHYIVNIMDVQVFPQCYSAIATLDNCSIIKEFDQVLLCDIGGYTADFVPFLNGLPLADKCFTLEMGLLKLYDKIEMDIMNEYGLYLNAIQIEGILNKKKSPLAKEIVERVNTLANSWIASIIDKVREHGYDTRTIPTIWLGGGSCTFAENIESSKMIGVHQVIRDIKANAIGYEKFLDIMG